MFVEKMRNYTKGRTENV